MHFARYFSICCFAIVLKMMAIIDIKEAPSASSNGTGETTAHQTNPNAGDENSRKKLLEYETIVQNLGDRISSLQKSAFTLASSYFISQAVVFTALSTTNSLVCRDFWFPLLLSLFPGALYLFTIFKIGQEYIETKISQKKYKKLTQGEVCNMLGESPISILGDKKKDILEKEKERLTRNLCRYMCAFGLLAAVLASGVLWMLCWKSWYAFGPLAAVVAFGILWMLCGKSFIFMLRRIHSKLKHNAK